MACCERELQERLSGEAPGTGGATAVHVNVMEQTGVTANWQFCGGARYSSRNEGPACWDGTGAVSPGAAVPFTNTTGCSIAGTVHVQDVAAFNARTDFLRAYAVLKDNLLTPCTRTILTAAFTGNVPALGLFSRGGDVHGYNIDARRVHESEWDLDFQSRGSPHGQWVQGGHGQRRAGV